MALECVEGADMTGISDERGRRACGAAGFVRAGRLPDPARLLRRDRSSSAPKAVRRGHARLPGSRDGHLCTRPAFPRESNGAVVGLTQKCRVRCAEAVRQWGCSSADAGPGSSDNARQVSLRCSSADAGSGPLPAPAPSSDSNRNAHVGGAISGRSWRRRRTRSECPRRRDHQCGRDDQEARRVSHGSHSTLAVRAGRPRPRQAHRPGRGPRPYARPLPALGTRSHSS